MPEPRLENEGNALHKTGDGWRSFRVAVTQRLLLFLQSLCTP